MEKTSGYWQTVVDTMRDGLMVVDTRGTVVSMNKRAEVLTGYRKGQLLGKPCTTLKCTGCKVFGKGPGKKWCSLYSKGKVRSKRCQITNRDGKIIDVVKQASLLKDESGKTIGAVETFTDISEAVKKDLELDSLRKILSSEEGFHGILGRSPVMERLFALIENAARSDAPVAIYGESGTGKELVAEAIHALGGRRKKPFIKVNCAALNENLLESELFGHVRGAFTGADSTRAGRFEVAHEGGLFLDEVGDLPLATQVKLLRVLEQKELERVGDHRPIPVDVRVITATHKDLEAMVREKTFRKDLFYRINVIPIHVPSLRERTEDIPLLANFFSRRVALKSSEAPKAVSTDAMESLLKYSWPGNVRELQSAIEYAYVLCQDGRICREHLPPKVIEGGSAKDTIKVASPGQLPGKLSEKEVLLEALKRAKGNQTEAGRLLGISRVTVWKRMKKHGIKMEKGLNTVS